MNRNIFKLVTMVLSCFVLVSCTKELEDLDGAALIKKYDLAGKYHAQITPAFMGLAPVTSDTYTINIDEVDGGKLRLHYKGFRDIHTEPRPKMPFEMTVDITMDIKKGPNNTLLLEGKNGIFKALPPDGKPINPDDVPDGIQLPAGAEGGLFSNIAAISGTYGETEKNGKLEKRFEFKLIPGLPLPVQILIYTHYKQ